MNLIQVVQQIHCTYSISRKSSSLPPSGSPGPHLPVPEFLHQCCLSSPSCQAPFSSSHSAAAPAPCHGQSAAVLETSLCPPSPAPAPKSEEISNLESICRAETSTGVGGGVFQKFKIVLDPEYDLDPFPKCNHFYLWPGTTDIKKFKKMCSLLLDFIANRQAGRQTDVPKNITS